MLPCDFGYTSTQLGWFGASPVSFLNRFLQGVGFVAVVLNAPPTRNQKLLAWVDEMVALCEPESVHWFEGSDKEYELLCKQLVESGTFVELDPAKRPGSYWTASD